MFHHIPRGFDVALFEFIGCGNSEDGYLTYGLKEKYDLEKILREIDDQFNYKEYFIWGRSMGAAVTILFAEKFLKDLPAILEKRNSKVAEEKIEQPKSKTKIPTKKKKYTYETVYEKKNGKIFKKVKRTVVEEEDINVELSEKQIETYSKIKGLILDSSFTKLFNMIQGNSIPIENKLN